VVAAAGGVLFAIVVVVIVWVATRPVSVPVQILNASSGRCLGTAFSAGDQGRALGQQPCSGRPNTLWHGTDLHNGYLQYQHVQTRLCLAAHYGTADVDVVLRPCDSQLHQQWWRWNADQTGHHMMESGLGGLCLALDDESSGDESSGDDRPVQIHACAGVDGESWDSA
jgi:hypothetical protein